MTIYDIGDASTICHGAKGFQRDVSGSAGVNCGQRDGVGSD